MLYFGSQGLWFEYRQSPIICNNATRVLELRARMNNIKNVLDKSLAAYEVIVWLGH